ncbi:hypothetical protein GCM10010149_59100 [Nonomuraea roseoviolacea subsp. roseoviolacea]
MGERVALAPGARGEDEQPHVRDEPRRIRRDITPDRADDVDEVEADLDRTAHGLDQQHDVGQRVFPRQREHFSDDPLGAAGLQRPAEQDRPLPRRLLARAFLLSPVRGPGSSGVGQGSVIAASTVR